jgi:protein phosphatase
MTAFPLTTFVIAIIVAVAILVVLLVVFGVARRRTSRERQHAVGAPAGGQERDPGEEITQPLPAAIRPQVQAPSAARLRAAQHTDRGRVRSGSENEDDTLIMDLKDEAGEVRTALYAVADGMGGHEKGEIASRAATRSVERALETSPFFQSAGYHAGTYSDRDVAEVLRSAVMVANREVYALKMDQQTNMGTTMVLALVTRSKAYVANVGDSRAYLLRGDDIHQITEDHSLVERMVASGQITQAEARLHPQRNLVFRSLGTEPNVEVDLFVEPLQTGDRLLLCSDGLTNMLPDDRVAYIVGREPDPESACRALVRAANEAGGKDNISVVLAEVLPG